MRHYHSRHQDDVSKPLANNGELTAEGQYYNTISHSSTPADLDALVATPATTNTPIRSPTRSSSKVATPSEASLPSPESTSENTYPSFQTIEDDSQQQNGILEYPTSSAIPEDEVSYDTPSTTNGIGIQEVIQTTTPTPTPTLTPTLSTLQPSVVPTLFRPIGGVPSTRSISFGPYTLASTSIPSAAESGIEKTTSAYPSLSRSVLTTIIVFASFIFLTALIFIWRKISRSCRRKKHKNLRSQFISAPLHTDSTWIESLDEKLEASAAGHAEVSSSPSWQSPETWYNCEKSRPGQHSYPAVLSQAAQKPFPPDSIYPSYPPVAYYDHNPQGLSHQPTYERTVYQAYNGQYAPHYQLDRY